MDEKEFYTRYYAATATSRANPEYCQRLFGADWAQHGFAEVCHLDHLVAVSGMRASSRVLDLGCGNGGIAGYFSLCTGAHITGLDFIDEAIQQAQGRLPASRGRLDFRVMDMARLDFPPTTFDIITAVDTLYFIKLEDVLPVLATLLKPGGRLVAFWSQGADPGNPLETFDRTTLPPDRTELAVALEKHGLRFQTWDYTHIDYAHALRKGQIAECLRDGFDSEGNLFLYENHRDEARGVARAFEAGAHARYLYRVEV